VALIVSGISALSEILKSAGGNPFNLINCDFLFIKIFIHKADFITFSACAPDNPCRNQSISVAAIKGRHA